MLLLLYTLLCSLFTWASGHGLLKFQLHWLRMLRRDLLKHRSLKVDGGYPIQDALML